MTTVGVVDFVGVVTRDTPLSGLSPARGEGKTGGAALDPLPPCGGEIERGVPRRKRRDISRVPLHPSHHRVFGCTFSPGSVRRNSSGPTGE